MQRLNLLNPRHINFWLLLVFTTGVILSSIQFFGHSSMWFDELTCALNVQHHSYYQLMTQSLDYNQVAPVGFLLFEKFATTLFGENDFAFRFFPWIWSLVSLVFFLDVVKHFLKGPLLVAAFILFATSVSHWLYAGEAKQYSGDISASLFLVWSALQLLKTEIKRATVWLIAGLGFLLIISSLPAIVIATFLLSMLLLMLRKIKIGISKQYFFIIALCWVVACALGALYAKFVISENVQGAMSAYWSRGFAPLDNVSGYLQWTYNTLVRELSFLLTFWTYLSVPQITLIAKVLLLLSIPGILFLVRNYRLTTLMLFCPFIIAIVLATARILPFSDRVAVYATWPFIISGIAGISALQNWLPQLFKPVVSTALGLVIALSIIFITLFLPSSERPPSNAQSSQPVLRELKKQMQPGDILFVYYRARHAVKFYGPREGITDYIVGNDHKDISGYLRDIDSLKGNKRVWFFFTQWVPPKPYPDSMKKYMGTVIGKEIGRIPDPDGFKEDLEVAAHLYDLSGQK